MSIPKTLNLIKNYLLAFAYFTLFVHFGYSQNPKKVSKDSLEAITKTIARNLNEFDYQHGIENSLLLVDLSKRNDDPYYHYHAHNFLGVAYAELNDSIRAKENYLSALNAAMKSENDTLLIWAYNNLGNSFSESPATREKGISYYDKVIKLTEKLNLPDESFTPKINIAWTYLDMEEYDKAYPYLKETLAFSKRNNDPNLCSELFMLMGNYYEGKSEIDSAKFYYKNAARIVDKHSLLLTGAMVMEEYADMLFAEGNYKEAFTALKKHKEYNSKVFQKEKLAQIEAANARFSINEYQKDLELAKKEKTYNEITLKESQEKFLVMLISSCILIICLLVLFKINQSRKNLIKELKVKNAEHILAKEKAENLSMLKTRFFSTVSHELRTPLYGVVGLTSLLLEDESLSKHKNDLNSLKFSADYLLALINDVLQMNKMESNLVNLENISFHFSDLMRSITNTFEFTRLQNKNEFQVEIDENIPNFLIGDSVRLSQILMNLVGNAVKFTERGKIKLSAELVTRKADKVSILFKVKDNGIGIPKNKQKEIFEEFSQLRSSNYNYQGTGLGLPIVKKLLELYGSNIELVSNEGEGSEFSFVIDFKEDEQQNISNNYSEGIQQPVYDVNTSKNVLIVDDNRINQVVTRRILEKENFTVVVAQDGKEAIEKAKETSYDVILMDLNMPGISGIEATKLIREFNSEVPILALTAVEIEEVRASIFEAGMNDFIVKPYDTRKFFQIIHRNLVAHRNVQNV